MTRPILSSTSITGTDVKNHNGESIGNVEDLMIDTNTGRVNYAVLSFGGFMGIGDKLFAVPMDQFTVDKDDETFVLNVTKDRLKEAPGFDKDDWPNFADQSFSNQINTFYGQTGSVQ